MGLNKRKVLYVDMDNVLVDFQSGIDQLDDQIVLEFKERLDEVPNIFSLMIPIKDSIESYKVLCEYFDTYILSTSPWNNETALKDKLVWVKKYLGQYAHKRLILTHHKNLNIGDYLVDDREKNGADKFSGKLIKFGSTEFPDWTTVRDYLMLNR